MNAANAPAQVMPLKIEPTTPYLALMSVGNSSTTLSVPLAPTPL